MDRLDRDKNKILEEIYKEFGDQICLYSYLGGFFDGKALFPCTEIHSNDVRWFVGKDIKSTYSNEFWRNMRRHFATKTCHENEYCHVCSFNEKNNFSSSRIAGNRMFTEIMPDEVIETVRNIQNNDFDSEIKYFHWFPSHYCNFECIMCSRASSTRREAFENKNNLNRDILPIIPTAENKKEVYEILKKVNGIGLTGGETILQPEVHEALDYLISIDRAKYVRINLLTNASSFPDKLVAKFKKFKEVTYSVSIDGTDDIIEYQRRGAVWKEVAANTLKIRDNFPMVINFVVTSVSIFGVIDFLRWARSHEFNHITFFPVKEPGEHLSLDTMPDKLKKNLLEKLYNEKINYSGDNNFDKFYSNLLESVIVLLEQSKYDFSLMQTFIERIKLEDAVSKKPLVEVVPEWKQYFE